MNESRESTIRRIADELRADRAYALFQLTRAVALHGCSVVSYEPEPDFLKIAERMLDAEIAAQAAPAVIERIRAKKDAGWFA